MLFGRVPGAQKNVRPMPCTPGCIEAETLLKILDSENFKSLMGGMKILAEQSLALWSRRGKAGVIKLSFLQAINQRAAIQP